MLSYRHAFHAGNHADVLKHVALLALCDAARSRGLDAERALRTVVQQRIALAQGETQETT